MPETGSYGPVISKAVRGNLLKMSTLKIFLSSSDTDLPNDLCFGNCTKVFYYASGFDVVAIHYYCFLRLQSAIRICTT